jgi:hypothetical protein
MYVLLCVHPFLLSGFPFVCISRTAMIQGIEIQFQGLFMFVHLYRNRAHLSHSVLHFIFGRPPRLPPVAAISGQRGRETWPLTCDNTLLCPRTPAHILTYVTSAIFTVPNWSVRRIFGDCFLLATSTGTLHSPFVFLGIILLGHS